MARSTQCMRKRRYVLAAAERAVEEPFVLVSTSKKQSDALAKEIAMICPQARVKMYSSDSTPAERRDFEDVNRAWADVDVLITDTRAPQSAVDEIRLQGCRVFCV